MRPVVIIGAGPAGLASAAALQRAGLPAVVLEQGDAVGASWRRRYDHLRLNSSRWFSQLPGARFARGSGVFPARDEMVRYLEAYASSRRFDVRLGTHVRCIDGDGDGWVLRTSGGDVEADQVLVAAGHDHTPHVPDWPGRSRFRNELVHSAAYRTPEPYRGADVLVVGPGCSGTDIAHDLVTHGAGRVRLAVRTPPNILVKLPAGPALASLMLRLPTERADAIMTVVRRKKLGDLAPYGLPVPEEGMFSRLQRLGVAPAIVDMPFIEAVKDGRIEIVAGVEALDETGVQLADGTRVEPDAVIAATGYRTGLEPLVGHLGVLNGHGAPCARPGEPAAPGLRFIGYLPLPAMLGRLGGEARRAAEGIARETRGEARISRPSSPRRARAARSAPGC
jgi:putative flavoprotein involved in K+ transport